MSSSQILLIFPLNKKENEISESLNITTNGDQQER